MPDVSSLVFFATDAAFCLAIMPLESVELRALGTASAPFQIINFSSRSVPCGYRLFTLLDLRQIFINLQSLFQSVGIFPTPGALWSLAMFPF